MDETERLRKSVEANILIQNYGQVRQELMLYITNYKSNVKYLNYVLVAVVAIVSIAMRDKSGFTVFESRLFWIMSSFSLTTVVGYISYDLLESQYALKALASRAAVLEQLINDLIGKNYLILTASETKRRPSICGDFRQKRPMLQFLKSRVITGFLQLVTQ